MDKILTTLFKLSAVASGLMVSSAALSLEDPIPNPIVKGSLQIELQSIATGVNSPNFLTHAGDGTNRLFFTEQGGTVGVIENGVVSPTPFLDVSSRLPTNFGSPISGFGLGGLGLPVAALTPTDAGNCKV